MRRQEDALASFDHLLPVFCRCGENKGKLAFFGGIKNARFKRQVVPGDVLELRCELTRQVGSVGFGKAEARVNGKLAAQGELTFAVAQPGDP